MAQTDPGISTTPPPLSAMLETLRQRHGLVDGADRVVIGDREHREPRLRGPIDQFGRRQPAVRGSGVEMEVDQGEGRKRKAEG